MDPDQRMTVKIKRKRRSRSRAGSKVGSEQLRAPRKS